MQLTGVTVTINMKCLIKILLLLVIITLNSCSLRVKIIDEGYVKQEYQDMLIKPLDQDFLVEADSIPCQIGQEFGTLFQIIDKNIDTLRIAVEWKYPEPRWIGDRDYESTKYQLRVLTNDTVYINYFIADSSQLMLGAWNLSILYDERELVSRTFKLKKGIRSSLP